MLIILYVVLEDQHINSLESLNEDGLRQSARNFRCFLGEGGCLRYKGVKLVPLILFIDLLM